MIEGKLSRRYAVALFQLASESAKDEEVGQELERFCSVYSVPPLSAVLTNPAFSVQSRKRVAVQIAEELKLSSLVIRFLSLLVDRDRLSHLQSILLYYRRLQDEARGRVQAGVTSASPLEAEGLEKVRSALKGLSGKEVVLKEKTDEGLLGGVMVEMEGKVYDGSVRTQLEKMRKQIEQGY
ncbi:MAG TPA: ATP synthase F1 subunit delta [Candidatus Binatia bacterium]|nr:ATP synthase F1 subunit delta [Candidatus Binatia bacterium]